MKKYVIVSRDYSRHENKIYATADSIKAAKHYILKLCEEMLDEKYYFKHENNKRTYCVEFKIETVDQIEDKE